MRNSYDTDLANKCDFFSTVDNIENCLNIWSSGDLTLAGRIQIFKTLAMAVYISTMTKYLIPNYPSLCLMKFNRDLFIWNKKRPKVRHSTLIEIMKRVTTRMWILPHSLKMIWIRRLLYNNYRPWKLIPTKLSYPLGGVTFSP